MRIDIDLSSTDPHEADLQEQELVFTQTLDHRFRRRKRKEISKRECLGLPSLVAGSRRKRVEYSRKRREGTGTRRDLLSGEATRWSVEV